jgi:hypothetical protein
MNNQVSDNEAQVAGGPLILSLLCSMQFFPLNSVYLIKHYVIKIVSDLKQIGGFLQVLQFPQTIKLTNFLHNVNVVSGIHVPRHEQGSNSPP